jgi:hypothetical protein
MAESTGGLVEGGVRRCVQGRIGDEEVDEADVWDGIGGEEVRRDKGWHRKRGRIGEEQDEVDIWDGTGGGVERDCLGEILSSLRIASRRGTSECLKHSAALWIAGVRTITLPQRSLPDPKHCNDNKQGAQLQETQRTIWYQQPMVWSPVAPTPICKAPNRCP